MTETLPENNLNNPNENNQKFEWEGKSYEDAWHQHFAEVASKEEEEYQKHMQGMSERDNGTESMDYYIDAVESGELKDSIDRKINEIPELRRMDMMARHIAELRNSEIKNEQTERMIKDKEDKLNELLASYDPPLGEEIIDRIIDHTIFEPEGIEVKPESGELEAETRSESEEVGAETRPEPESEELEEETEIEARPEDVEIRHGRRADARAERDAEDVRHAREIDERILDDSDKVRFELSGWIGSLLINIFDRFSAPKYYYRSFRTEWVKYKLERRSKKLNTSRYAHKNEKYEKRHQDAIKQVAFREKRFKAHKAKRQNRLNRASKVKI